MIFDWITRNVLFAPNLDGSHTHVWDSENGFYTTPAGHSVLFCKCGTWNAYPLGDRDASNC